MSVLSFDEAAKLVPREEGVSKNEWKRRVKNVVRESKKKAAKGKREREEKKAEDKRQEDDRKQPDDLNPHLLQQPGIRKKKKKELAMKPERNVRLVIDCSFEKLMTDKELHSLSQQIRDSYSANLHMQSPCRLIVAIADQSADGPESSSKTRKLLDLHHAHHNWVHFQLAEQSFETLGLANVMYLSSDAEQVLESVPVKKSKQ